MGDDDRGQALIGIQLVQEVHHRGGGGGIEGAGRFIGEQQRRVPDERAGDRHALFLPAREVRRAVVDPLSQSDLVQPLLRVAQGAAARCAAIEEGQADILGGGEAGEQMEGLEHEADAAAPQIRQRCVTAIADRVPVETRGAGAGAIEQADDVHQGGLAAPRGAHDGEEIPGLHREIDPLEDRGGHRAGAEVPPHPAQGQDRRGGCGGAPHQGSTTVSPALRPRVITTESSVVRPTVTGRGVIVPVA